MKAYVHLETFNGNARFSTWLTRIAINSALMALRRKRSHPENAMEFTDGETWHKWEIADRSPDINEIMRSILLLSAQDKSLRVCARRYAV